MKKGILCAIFVVLSLTSKAQNVFSQHTDLLEVRREVFERLRQNVQQYSLSPKERIEISSRIGIPMTISLEGDRVARFQYLDGENHPVYYTTHNVTAAITNGARTLQTGGSLNVELEGQGMIVGIYDQTRPRVNHSEFGNRVTQLDGSTETISNHATHVTGTILASGNNANARGMARAATGWAFNWDADVSKMMQNSYDPDLNPSGHLISNHSYGILVGWFRDNSGNWAWSGNESISSREDYRFGFYTAKSRQIDELTFAKPYYTVVWAAGNDRSDIGDGTREADGPGDSIGPEGVAKNNITIGAVNGISNYTGPESVVMSSFSSWGPVDDGRIKPDLVSMGVNVFSTAIINDGAADGYATLSGTSMAAPNVTGAMLLLQELYRNRNAGRYMRSATLKALTIQTAKEAGMNEGPDYMNGWGLLDAEASARMIIDENGSSKAIRELVLDNGQTYEFDFISDGIEPIKVTIAWTDPPGTSPSPSLNPRTPMLVNDLDIRIIAEDGTVFFPWTLNPNGGVSAVAARNADNFRDNVEQIEIKTPSSQRYTVRVNHKRALQHARQPYSLVFSAGVVDGQVNTLYWIGQNANWNNPNNWSLSSNGPAAGIVPNDGTRVVIDQPVAQGVINLSANTQAFSVNLFGNSPFNLNLNGNTLTLESGLRSSNPEAGISNGTLAFEASNTNENVLDFGQVALSNVDVNVNEGNWRVLTLPTISSLVFNDATVNLDLAGISVGNLQVMGNSALTGRLGQVTFTETLEVDENASFSPEFSFNFNGTDGVFEDASKGELDRLIVTKGSLSVQSIGQSQSIRVLSGELEILQESVETNVIEMNRGVSLVLPNNGALTIMENILFGSGSGTTTISAAGKARIIHNVYRKYCAQQVSVTNVDLEGQAVVNFGPNASLVNSANWLNIACDNVLFPNFEVRFSCAGGLTEFINLTEGTVTSYSWSFGNLGSSTSMNPTFIFNNARSYNIVLTVRGPGGTSTFEQTVAVSPNTLAQPQIVINGSQLTSLVPAGRYQWYRNGNRIDGATTRSYMADDGGSYQVTVIDDACNRLSAPVVISSLENEPDLGRLGYSIGPNPVTDKLVVGMRNSYLGEVVFEIYSTSGKLMRKYTMDKAQFEASLELDISFSNGLYVLKIRTGQSVVTKKILKE
ncbi:S8 family serine peptidase [Lunatibacter salilacus]|uniref:S8 family serine peptidase n=1 Tax=Lunatibacter salilacus TaxID=2483804 RepID=UPI00131D8C9B|nr:S8 family serine peptidase [Lunatibacter salilacus]